MVWIYNYALKFFLFNFIQTSWVMNFVFDVLFLQIKLLLLIFCWMWLEILLACRLIFVSISLLTSSMRLYFRITKALLQGTYSFLPFLITSLTSDMCCLLVFFPFLSTVYYLINPSFLHVMMLTIVRLNLWDSTRFSSWGE